MRKLQLLVLTAVTLLGVTDASRAEISIDLLIEQARITEGDVAVRDLPRWNGARKILIRDIGMNLDALTAGLGDVEVFMARSVPEAMQHVSEVDAIIGFCEAELIAAASQLVWVQIYWAGAESCLSVERVGNGDVLMTNMQKMSSPVIAEHAIAMMLSLTRHLPQFVHAMDGRVWAERDSLVNGMTPIAGKKLLVAGLGGIGSEVARLGAALGMHVSGTRNSSREGPKYVEYVGLSHELLDLAAQSDVIVNALPLTAGTRNLFDEDFFNAVKPGAIFINVGRGQTVVTDDLLAALESGQVSGAGLDVTQPEPLPVESPLWQRDDVIITPHSAGRGGELERHGVLLLENLRRYIAGDHLLNVVDPQKGY
jgi:phosphoglycerate dehydrogenase-like enzyme